MQVLFAAEPLDARVFQGETIWADRRSPSTCPRGRGGARGAPRGLPHCAALTLDGTEKKMSVRLVPDRAAPVQVARHQARTEDQGVARWNRQPLVRQALSGCTQSRSVDDVERIEPCREARFRSYGECAAVIGAERVDLAHVLGAQVHAGVPFSLSNTVPFERRRYALPRRSRRLARRKRAKICGSTTTRLSRQHAPHARQSSFITVSIGFARVAFAPFANDVSVLFSHAYRGELLRARSARSPATNVQR